MKCSLPYLVAAVFSLLASGCEVEWKIEYAIENTTDFELLIETITIEGNAPRFDVVSPNDTLVFVTTEGIGNSSDRALERWDGITFPAFNVSIGDTIQFNGDEGDVTNWEKIAPMGERDVARVQLTITEADF